MPTATQLTASLAEHGEGPVWDAARSRLLCVDLEQGDLLEVDPAATDPSSATAGVRRVHVADAVAALRPRASGGWVLGVQRRFALVDDIEALLAGREQASMLTSLWDDRDHRMNEGSCDPGGRFYCGSMAYDAAQGEGDLWRLDPDGTARIVVPGVTISNGLGWSPDGSRAYYIDTPTGRVDVLLVDPGTGDVVHREPFVTLPEGPGGPDGLSVDAEGGVWVARYGGGQVLRFDADGALSERVDVPTPHPTAVTLGGEGLDTLYITTSTQGLDPTADHLAGALFTHPAGVRGQLPLPFAG